jgi:hypothetical protein
LFGTTAQQTGPITGVGVTFPTFFNNILMPAQSAATGIGGTWQQYTSSGYTTTTGTSFALEGSGTANIAYFVIGT